MRVAIDAMGGDRAPDDIIEGVQIFVAEDSETEIILVGNEALLKEKCSDLPVRIVHAPSVVDMHESPSAVLKKKLDSSIAVATKLVKEKQADALLSMGNSGATMAFALFLLGRLPNISRPGIVAPMPTLDGFSLLLDVGATVDCKPLHLLHFAIMGSIYCQLAFNVDQPRIGLLSIGEEESKGNELTLNTAKLLQKAPLNFIGNIEGVDLMKGKVDVIVCDGFVGNVILKFGEGLVEMFSRTLKFETDLVLGDDIDAEHRITLLKETMQRVDYTSYGGALLLGVQGHCLIGHGRSNPRAIASGIRSAKNAADKCPIDAILKALQEAEVESRN